MDGVTSAHGPSALHLPHLDKTAVYFERSHEHKEVGMVVNSLLPS